MKEYQSKSQKHYVLPEAVYRQALWAVKDLPRLKERVSQLEEMADCLPPAYRELPGGHGRTPDLTGLKASELANLTLRIQAIEQGLYSVPEPYRDGILAKLAYGVPYGDQCHMNTWKRWQQVYLYTVAVNLQLY